jgi:uncharacterized protein YbjT (DUF2867 family)
MGLVRLVHLSEDRRDHYETSTHVWELMRTIVRERQRREIDPTITVLRQLLVDTTLRQEPAAVRRRLEDTLELLVTLTAWSEEMLALDSATPTKVLKPDGRIPRLMGSAEPAHDGGKGRHDDDAGPARRCNDRPLRRPVRGLRDRARRKRAMNILVCGSGGCVGHAVVQSLRARGHQVVETRRAERSAERLSASMLSLDFMTETSPALGARCGTAKSTPSSIAQASSSSRPKPLSARPHRRRSRSSAARSRPVSAVRAGSALGVDGPGASARPACLRSKGWRTRPCSLPIDGAVVRPSLVYGPGSESARLFATLACLPVVSLPGSGRQPVQPIHVFELAECIVRLLERPHPARGVHELGGDAIVGYRDMLATYRHALGFGEPLWLPVPAWAMRSAARLAELLPQRVLSRDTLRLLEHGNTTTMNAAEGLLGRAPTTLGDGLAITAPEPLFDLRVALGVPIERLLRGALAFLWLQTALLSALLPRESGVLELLAHCGFPGDAGTVALAFSCTLNATLGVATLFWPSARLYAVQVAAIVGYTATAAWHVPALTIDHCGPLAKNVPLLACVFLLWLARASTPTPSASERRDRRPAIRPAGSAAQRGGSTVKVADV